MNHRKYILNRYENRICYTTSMIASATPAKLKRPTRDEDENEECRPAKRRNTHPVAGYTRDSTLTSSYPSHTYTQDDHEQASISSTVPHPPNRAHATLRIKVPQRERSNMHLFQQALDSPYSPPSNSSTALGAISAQ
ncbi:hypothetical protein OPQ81_001384 [Rhizoctonia solani]|nr:hypothetical protein OPQ81_001384 [Rhizoctonia solani]